MSLSSLRSGRAVTAPILLLIGCLLAALGASSARAATPACTGSQLVETLSSLPGGGTAGTDFLRLNFANLGGTCELRGFPGVSAVNLQGRQLGAAARRQAGAEKEVTLKAATSSSAQTAVETIGFIDTGAIPGCDPRLAAGLRIYAPGSTTAKYVPFVFDTCTTAKQSDLVIRPIS